MTVSFRQRPARGIDRSARPAIVAVLAVALVLCAPAEGSADLLSPKDLRQYSAAFEQAERGRWAKVEWHKAHASAPLPAKILTWLRYREQGNGASFADITRFIRDNPDWPDRDSLRRRAEEAITEKTPAADVLAWFERHPPLTTDGMMALTAALAEAGQGEKARAMARRTWIEGDFGRRQEYGFVRRYRKWLDRADHLARLDRLLWDGRHRAAQRMLRRVDKGHKALAIARIRLRRTRGGVDWAIRQVPKEMRRDAGLLYERLRWRRRKGRDEDALEILKKPPPDMVHAELWWRERSVLARRLLVKGMVTDAYRVARDHGLGEGRRYAEAEWLSGWIALRFLGDGSQALPHFERLYKAVSYPISRARAAYWAGRAAEDAGRDSDAERWYAIAARLDATYYGQLAAIHGDEPATPSPRDDPRPGDAAADAFEKAELARAVRVLDALEQDELMRVFFVRLADLSDSPAHKVLAGRLAKSIGRPDLGVLAGRSAYHDGIMLMPLAYPVIDMPDGKPERALLLAIARQESNFEPNARSHAGARGLMQLMPSTARAVSRMIKTRFSRHRLTTDPDYNIRLGRAYLARLIDRYDGSYVLAIAAYNAGPAAVTGWIGMLGDPREESVDVIDWIEQIPYAETRNYIQRVMENLQVYRHRLDGTRIALSLERDLGR